MESRTTEVADRVFQITTHIAEIDFSFNQYLIAGDEPMLFHTGGRGLFPLVRDAVQRVIPVDSLRWVSFGHVESDECGSMNQWLAAAPAAAVTHGALACMVSLNDLCDRPPVVFANGDHRDIGGHVMQWHDTPHVPHGWEAGVIYDGTTKTLFCGDLFTRIGNFAPISDADLIGPAVAAEDVFHASSLNPNSAAIVRGLADLDVNTLALMHGPAFTGDCRAALLALADDFERRCSMVVA
jgi:flavorubredoxin